MIRVGLPVPTLLRLRLRAQLTARRLSRQADEMRQEIGGLANRRLISISGLVVRLRPAPVNRDTEVDLSHFEERFQHLVDLLCGAAHAGVTGADRQRYSELRAWFLTHYESLRPRLSRHLGQRELDFALSDSGESATRDDFESLFLPQELDHLIHSDTVIARIERTRRALESYRNSLEPVPA